MNISVSAAIEPQRPSQSNDSGVSSVTVPLSDDVATAGALFVTAGDGSVGAVAGGDGSEAARPDGAGGETDGAEREPGGEPAAARGGRRRVEAGHGDLPFV